MIKKTGKTYEVRAWWRDLNGKKHSKYKSGFKTLTAAKAWEEDIISSGSIAEYPDAHKLTVSGLYDLFKASRARGGRAPTTLSWYEVRIQKLLKELGGMRVQDVRRPHVQTFIDNVRDGDNKLSPSTVDGVFRAVRALFGYAAELGVIPASPAVRIKRPEVLRHEASIYSPAELAALIRIMEEQRHPLLYPLSFCVYYGLRRGEALGLRWCDVDFEAGTIHVRGNLTTYYDTALRREHTVYKKVKTRYSDAAVAASGRTLNALKELKNERFLSGMVRYPRTVDISGAVDLNDLDPLEFICLTSSGKLFRPGSITTQLKSLQKANGLKPCTVHDLRHTYGTVLVENGLDVAVVSKALRHSTINITSDLYVSASTRIKRKATEAMADIIELASSPEKSQQAENL